jgi:hypothetical protein
LNELRIRCNYCGGELPTEGNPVLRLSEEGSIAPAPGFQWVQCPKCKQVAVMTVENGVSVVKTESPGNCYMPRYCITHQLAYFGPSEQCPFCVEKGVRAHE